MEKETIVLADALEDILANFKKMESLKRNAEYQIGEYHKIDDDLIFAIVPSAAGDIKLNLDMGHWELQYNIQGRGAYCCTLRDVDNKKCIDLRNWKVTNVWSHSPFNTIAIIRLKK